MMRIVKRGERPESIIREAMCMHCRSTMEFTSDDPSVTSTKDRDGIMYQFNCPVCAYVIITTGPRTRRVGITGGG